MQRNAIDRIFQMPPPLDECETHPGVLHQRKQGNSYCDVICVNILGWLCQKNIRINDRKKVTSQTKAEGVQNVSESFCLKQ